MFTHIQHQVEKAFSSERARQLDAAIHSHDRWSTFSQYRLSGNYIATRMREYGLEDVELLELPADGESKFGDWVMPLAWDVAGASLEIVEPVGAARILADYDEEPASLAMWSAPTPRGGMSAEVILLEDGRHDEDYTHVDIKGKVVFSSQHASQVRGPAARHGALGVISDYPACEDDALAEGVCWINAWSDYHGWGFLRSDTPIFGFSLNREKGAYLRRLLEAGERVTVRTVVQSWLYEGQILLPTGVIRGESDEEVLVYSHAYEYGAEDNAAGCAVALEAARTLSHLIEHDKLPRPKRSIRFMMSWECYGSIAWCVQRIADKKNVVAGLCLDDMGGKRQLTGGQIRVIEDSHCQASYADFAASAIAEACFHEEEGFAWEMAPWGTGTDHAIFQDPSFDVPMPWLTEHPAGFHHTSLDKTDKIDPQSLHVEGVFAATYLYFLATAGDKEVPWLAQGTRRMWQKPMSEAERAAADHLGAQDSQEALAEAHARGRERIEYLANVGKEAVLSIERICNAEATKRVLRDETDRLMRERDHLLETLEQEAKQSAKARGWELRAPGEFVPSREGADRVPKRLVPGPITLCDISPEDRPVYEQATSGQNPMWSRPLILALYRVDGKRTVGEIERLVALELGESEVDLLLYFRFLEEHGLIKWA
ncbi:MAG: DUF4910 domain-containing protein [Chloroflexota bacterium]|nr:DUF4910 domain-containing protein [Chloroflexota bacterium]